MAAKALLPSVFGEWRYKLGRRDEKFIVWAWPANMEDVKLPEPVLDTASGVTYVYAASPDGQWPTPFDLENFKFFLRGSLSNNVHTQLELMEACGWLPKPSE